MPVALVTRAAPLPLSSALSLDADGARRLRDAFLAGRNANTRRAYAQTAGDFAGFLSRRAGRQVDEPEAVRALLSHGSGAANLLALDYRADLLERVSSGTVALRLSNLRALVKLARTTGMVEWTLEVASVKVRRWRDTEGPGLDVVRLLAVHVRGGANAARSARDRALLALLYGQGLRRAEAVSLDVAHMDLAGGRISVLGKGHTDREWVRLSPAVAEALAAWLAVRPGVAVGPLLLGWDGVRGRVGGRLSAHGVYRLTTRWGLAAAGVKVRPHGLRHTAATALLDAGTAHAEVAGFMRHADLSTLAHYDDNRKRRGNAAAARLAELVPL